ncbi:hypothetical protein ELH06_12370 [Rhizobium ruizarguesonis]|uniref:hypothetical protein n=1 Tax=Rhizobium ruizarguesonis TaxID=2081791 RepID=UPI00103127C1|nr:hypothetical protein [Rhizobium ruizarguesonis]TBE49901.1 hypothetical protein ELH06_12370 [Rhizobium ruizarguesonis]
MDPITAIVTALALGASTGIKDVASQAVKEAYTGLRNLIKNRFPAVSLEQLEQMPSSENLRSVVEKDLHAANAQNDTELAAKAQALLELIEQVAPQAAPAIGIDFHRVKAANIRLREIVASGAGVRVVDAEVIGDIEVSNVQAGVSRTDPTKKV